MEGSGCRNCTCGLQYKTRKEESPSAWQHMRNSQFTLRQCQVQFCALPLHTLYKLHSSAISSSFQTRNALQRTISERHTKINTYNSHLDWFWDWVIHCDNRVAPVNNWTSWEREHWMIRINSLEQVACESEKRTERRGHWIEQQQKTCVKPKGTSQIG